MFDFDFLVPIVVVGTITLGIYKLFELFVCRRERMMMIERMADLHVQGIPKLQYGLNFKFRLSFSPLKWGCLLMGIGLGVLLGYFICWNTIPEFPGDLYYNSNTLVATIFGACVLLMGGAGLLVAFLIELKVKQKDGEEKLL